jgi:hypothetical protein
MKLLAVIALLIVAGCTAPDAPDVRPPNGQPDDWPVFKGETNMETKK